MSKNMSHSWETQALSALHMWIIFKPESLARYCWNNVAQEAEWMIIFSQGDADKFVKFRMEIKDD